MARWVLICVAATIALADLVQVPSLDWGVALVGPVGGAFLYIVVAVATANRRSLGPWIAVLLPLLPTGLLIDWAAGGAAPVTSAMVAIFPLQLVAAAAGITVLRGGQGQGADSRSGVPPSS